MRKIFVFTVMMLAAFAVQAQKQGVRINGVVWAERNMDDPGEFAKSVAHHGKLYQWNRNEAWDYSRTVELDGEKWNNKPADGKEFSKENDPCPHGWRVPSKKDFDKLLDTEKVFSTWATTEGPGRLFIDRKTGKSIFLPAAGGRNINGEPSDRGRLGLYWSRTRSSETRGVSLIFTNNVINPTIVQNLANGYSVRCVKK